MTAYEIPTHSLYRFGGSPDRSRLPIIDACSNRFAARLRRRTADRSDRVRTTHSKSDT